MSTNKINLIVRLQHWMDSVPGQTFLNYAYSWGASIVILGTLFKLTHLPGANLMLYIGMGTEVVVFFLSAFDRPFDKQESGKDLADDYETDEEIEAKLNGDKDEDEDEEEAPATPVAGGGFIFGGAGGNVGAPAEGGVAATSGNGGVSGGGGTVVIGGFGGGGNAAAPQGEGEAVAAASAPANGVGVSAGDLAGVMAAASNSLLQQAESSINPEMEEATMNYVEKLKLLTDTLTKVEAQSARLTTDSEEMVNLNRTLTGINTVYELQLKSISTQVGTIDQINEQTRRMASQIEELNGVYSRMIKALTVNMKNAAGVAGSSDSQ